MVKDRITPDDIRKLKGNEVFVFGSNEKGFHGAGAARYALDHFGAVMGQGEGIQGQSYAIPTMYNTLAESKGAIDTFVEYARHHSNKKFLVTPIGCGIAGYTPEEVAPYFKEAIMVKNISLPESFWNVLKSIS